jgi:hypothetical protein
MCCDAGARTALVGPIEGLADTACFGIQVAALVLEFQFRIVKRLVGRIETCTRGIQCRICGQYCGMVRQVFNLPVKSFLAGYARPSMQGISILEVVRWVIPERKQGQVYKWNIYYCSLQTIPRYPPWQYRPDAHLHGNSGHSRSCHADPLPDLHDPRVDQQRR